MIPDGNELTVDIVQKHIFYHPVSRYTTLMNYYRGAHPTILARSSPGEGKPDNRLVNNFPGYIVDVNLGYFLGSPIRYSVGESGDEFVDKLKEIFKYNDEHDENVELAKVMGIKGHAFELLYFDEDAQLRFGVINPDNLIAVYDSAIVPNLKYAIRFWYEEFFEKKTLFVEVYTDTVIRRYQGANGQSITLIEEVEHPFGQVPVVEFMNNDERQSDFEKVASLIDAYDITQSDTGNDFEYFSDAYLKIKGMMGTDAETISNMRDNRVLLLAGDGDADWLIKQINDVASENYKTRLVDDIHKFSKTPNLTDEAFAGNLSGVALRFKLWGLEQNTAQKERKFKKGLQRRIELIAAYLSTIGPQFDWRDIEITFNRNIPENIMDIAEMVEKLKGTVSDETLLAQLPFVEDPAAEIEKREEENAGSIDLLAYIDKVAVKTAPPQDRAPAPQGGGQTPPPPGMNP